VAAQTAESYFNLMEVRARRQLLEGQHEINSAYLALVEERFERGLTSSIDVHQQAQLVAATEAQLALLGGEEAVASSQLAVLLGQPPGQRFAEGERGLPTLPAAPALGEPAELLSRRPDIAAARLRLDAADAAVADAVRAQLPSLLLQFTPSYDIAQTRYPQSE